APGGRACGRQGGGGAGSACRSGPPRGGAVGPPPPPGVAGGRRPTPPAPRASSATSCPRRGDPALSAGLSTVGPASRAGPERVGPGSARRAYPRPPLPAPGPPATIAPPGCDGPTWPATPPTPARAA